MMVVANEVWMKSNIIGVGTTNINRVNVFLFSFHFPCDSWNGFCC